MSEELNLTWSDIYNIKQLGSAPVSPGLYIWLLQFDENFIPYYAGKSSNIQKRLGEHLSCLLGGLYDIYPLSDMRNFVKFKRDKNGLAYSPASDIKLIDFVERFDEIKPHLFGMINNFYFTFAEYKHKREDINESSALHDIEKTIINKIGFDNLSNAYGGNSYYFKVNHTCHSNLKKYLVE